MGTLLPLVSPVKKMSSSTTLLVTICAVVAVACLFGGASAQSPDQACLFPKVGGNAYNFTGLFKDGPWEFMGSPSSSSSSSSTYTFGVGGTVECYNSEPNSAGCMTGGFSDEAGRHLARPSLDLRLCRPR